MAQNLSGGQCQIKKMKQNFHLKKLKFMPNGTFWCPQFIIKIFNHLKSTPDRKKHDVIENTFKNKTLTELEAEKLRLQSSLDKMKHKTITIKNDHYKNDEKARMEKILRAFFTIILYNLFKICIKDVTLEQIV